MFLIKCLSNIKNCFYVFQEIFYLTLVALTEKSSLHNSAFVQQMIIIWNSFMLVISKMKSHETRLNLLFLKLTNQILP